MNEELTETVEYLRILRCTTCRSMEELADWTGAPEDDVRLHYIDARHGGASAEPHERALLRVERKHWDDDRVRKQIVERMWAGTTGMVPEYYAARDTMKEDAAKCFIAHRRSLPCIDYRDRSKIIGNPARADRIALGKDIKRDLRGGGPRVYLCDSCVATNYVNQAKFQIDPDHKF